MSAMVVLQDTLEEVLDLSRASVILLNDKDGVLIARADSPSSSFDIDPWLATTFVNALEQFNKLQLGDTLSVTSEFDNVIIIQFNLLPLIVTFCIKPQANIGLIYALFPQLLSRLQPIRNKLLSDFN